MKLIKNSLIACLISTFFVLGCDILDQKPQLSIPADAAIYDERSAQVALNGIYSQLQSGDYYGGTFYIMSDVSSDIVQSIGSWDGFRTIDTYNTTVLNGEIEPFWAAAYAVINQANEIITILPTLTDINQEVRDQIMGEAYLLRALAYFDLNRAFGGVEGEYGTMGVPIVLEPIESAADVRNPSRSTIDETYAQVESDLKQTVALLSGGSDPTRATEAAAKALLARLYLYYKQDYALVENYASEVINNYDYELTENYESIFIQEKTVGSIFELEFISTDQSIIRNWYIEPSKGGRGDLALHKKFASLLLSRPNDERAELLVYRERFEVYYPNKYRKEGGIDNIQILRLAEMYLNRAEARVRKPNPDLSGALSDLNAIRNRAGLADTTGTGVDTPEEILDAIALERSIEFFQEGHRWFNLLRTGQALTVLNNVERANGANVSLAAGLQVWPIPARAVGANENLKQNPYYR